MIDFLSSIIDFIRIDFFSTIGIYSIIYFVVRLFYKNNKLKEFDSSAIETIINGGIIWAILFFVESILVSRKSESMYIYVLWIQGFFWFLATQLLRISFFRTFLIPRLFIFILLVVNLETFDIIAILLSKGHLPSTWSHYENISIDISTIDFILGFFLKISLFIAIVYSYSFIKVKVKTFYNNS